MYKIKSLEVGLNCIINIFFECTLPSVDLNSREEVSITGQHPALYLHHPDQPPVHPVMAGQDRHYRDRHSYSDTSSMYSGSDTMHSLQSGQEEMDLSGNTQEIDARILCSQITET